MQDDQYNNLLERIVELENEIKPRSKNKKNNQIQKLQPHFYFGRFDKFFSHKPTLFHNPKTAGRNFLKHFRSNINYFTHIPAYLIKEYVHKEDFNNSFKFAFIRNPYTRFISAYRFANIGNDVNKFCSLFGKFKLEFMIYNKIKHAEHFLSQCFFVKNKDHTQLLTDKLYRYDQFKEALEDLENNDIIENASNIFTVKFNETNYTDILTDENKKIIEDVYSMDFELYESI